MRNAQGLIEPRHMVWPAFWGVMEDRQIRPLVFEVLSKTVARHLQTAQAGEPVDATTGQAKGNDDPMHGYSALTTRQIAAALKAVQSDLHDGKQAVYVAGGKIHALDKTGSVTTFDHDTAQPYSWPLGHNVRPTGQSLGVHGCVECHGADTPLISGTVAATPASPDGVVVRTMDDFMSQDRAVWNAWAQGFKWRGAFKWFAFVAGGLLMLLIVAPVLHFATGERKLAITDRRTLGLTARWMSLLLVLSTAALAITAYVPLVIQGAAMRGWWLMAHTIVSGIFVFALTMAALTWTGAC